ncbi:3-phosphoshikimate 1-carboxyvinyltransferase [Zymomonas mobilis]|uniref:3-phosphoshikimate 1-carboxyvinyltransferase n=1 Tax=Zymomonas mobilis subsp. pomaceae (strain ATCC 29192 / DSM 22645 / JCM 10191 / CCUG 17912 / NBRC 13757 / NCIMB 11200 / NRRL B-4491 / Barker I) TaxID=579138 RepID=F8EUS8_ZYMMT|nr:3-phosphoshikimate 1-carboxyvinyltransferase [Zymomonas mobilis]AEI38224.1 3-phosphoshikimate 1-carboxyvinyltransferase [Zymomonas mobilis subsp. pomaceae ATCC 29192]MDX5947914.1 3-phosphoshikimate 1-carboxyvinyltransferase [Zymomonas mobilis subsp. pomaceae]GEB89975.1 3-phosphoshikimate 1-carboxyvinyltransferase [Zymomonas mobilis subsp. pomaceae]
MTRPASPCPLTSRTAAPLSGTVHVPGDKSISHRALMLSALAIGESQIDGLLEGEDVLATAGAMRAMGATIKRDKNGRWYVHGVGVGGLLEPETALDMGNSGTSTRLLMGVVASHPITATFIGDASLSKRPMGRISTPLSLMGARFSGAEGNRLPMTVTGLYPAVPLEYRLPMASAQVKSAILLAGLNTPGITRVIEPIPTRDHSERMLRGFGADLSVEEVDGVRIISIHGEATLNPQHIVVPGDPSSAAFLAVAALIVPGSNIVIENVGLNPTRAGIYTMLKAMGGNIEYLNPREVGGEPVADIAVRYSHLKAIEVPKSIVPSMIDEFPILFIAAAMAEGKSTLLGLGELRVKESDRIAVMAAGLKALRVTLEEKEDGLIIEGQAGNLLGEKEKQVTVASHLDHRIAMSFAVAGLVSKGGVEIDDRRPIMTSFPVFTALFKELGAEFEMGVSA